MWYNIMEVRVCGREGFLVHGGQEEGGGWGQVQYIAPKACLQGPPPFN
jgi:hypothetical protein